MAAAPLAPTPATAPAPQPPFQWVLGYLLLQVERLGNKSDLSPLYCIVLGVKNERSCNSTPLHAFMAYTKTSLPSLSLKYFHDDKITHKFLTGQSIHILHHHIPLLLIVRHPSQSNEWKLVNEPRIQETLHSTRITNSQTRD